MQVLRESGGVSDSTAISQTSGQAAPAAEVSSSTLPSSPAPVPPNFAPFLLSEEARKKNMIVEALEGKDPDTRNEPGASGVERWIREIETRVVREEK